MPTNRHVINETIAAYANAAIDAANAAGGREAVVEVRNQMIQVLDAMAANITLRISLDEEGYTSEQREEMVKNVFAGLNPIMIELLTVMASRCDVALLRKVYLAYE
ncbi:MAG: F0F1 ATP synthase subunit delta [Anaerotardibacter sp.]